MGVTLSDIQSHLKQRFSVLKTNGISCTTIHELMVALCKGTCNAMRYKGLVEVKVPGKDNSDHKSHQDGHFAFCQVNYVKEFCQKFCDECHIFMI